MDTGVKKSGGEEGILINDIAETSDYAKKIAYKPMFMQNM
jgi:hypothetical protein